MQLLITIPEERHEGLRARGGGAGIRESAVGVPSLHAAMANVWAARIHRHPSSLTQHLRVPLKRKRFTVAA
jgi:hypothetical protein